MLRQQALYLLIHLPSPCQHTLCLLEVQCSHLSPSQKKSPNVEIQPYFAVRLLDVSLFRITQAWDYQLPPSVWAFVPQYAVQLAVL